MLYNFGIQKGTGFSNMGRPMTQEMQLSVSEAHWSQIDRWIDRKLTTGQIYFCQVAFFIVSQVASSREKIMSNFFQSTTTSTTSTTSTSTTSRQSDVNILHLYLCKVLFLHHNASIIGLFLPKQCLQDELIKINLSIFSDEGPLVASAGGNFCQFSWLLGHRLSAM